MEKYWASNPKSRVRISVVAFYVARRFMNTSLFNAVLAGLALLWGYIKDLLSVISSLFVTEIIITSHQLSAGFMKYCQENCNKTNLGTFNYSASTAYVRSEGKWFTIAYEVPGPGSMTLWRESMRFFITRMDKDYHLKIYFIKGTYSPDTFVKMAETYCNYRFQWSSGRQQYESEKPETKIRFKIKRVYGKILSESKSDSKDCIEDSYLDYDLDRFRVVNWDIGDLGPKISKEKKPLDRLSFPQKIWDSVAELERWLASEEWYKKHLIPWKRGWVLHGIPGTGKTSLIKALAEHMGLPIVAFDLASFTDNDFSEEWVNLKHEAPCIALIEDIDTVFDKRKNISSHKGQQSLGFDCLLNMIDGIEDSDGIFTVITTNHIDKIDEALVGTRGVFGHSGRPGRIDKIIELTYIDADGRRKLANRILADCPDRIEYVINKEGQYTPAQFQYICEGIALSRYWETKKSEIGTR